MDQFHWTLREILERGGEGCICVAAFIERNTDDDDVHVFQQARAADYANLLRDIKHVSGAASGARNELSRLRQRFNQIKRIDFFAAREQEQIRSLLSRMQSTLHKAPASRK